jgi:predicted RNase H-like HicB family nuclease
MKEAIEFHLEGLRAEGLPVPEPQTTSDDVTIG